MNCQLIRAVVLTALVIPVFGCGDGAPTAPRLVASDARPATVDPSGPFMRAQGGIADLSGRCPSIAFVIGSIHIQTNAATLFQRAECSELHNGTFVDAAGARQPDGSLFAREVELVTGRR